ncbi:hypothetical protein B0J18DRAFT_471696 [Chaetomium sp. MPI-SDFR-AT-0129]|nr:hypothetical protein B0J18DRAFT_471696 [Chaetomium sp. MPI-SDFR-AT-0129]
MPQESDNLPQAVFQYRQWVLFNVSDPQDTKHITNAQQLTSLGRSPKSTTKATPSSSSSSQQSQQPVLPPIRLALLAPLAKRAVYNTCRMSCSYNDTKNKSGCVCPVLDISPVAEAWKQAIVDAPPAVWVRFDVTLPETVPGTDGGDNKNNTTQTFSWEEGGTQEVGAKNSAGVRVRTQDVAQLVMALATAVTECARGEGVQLGVVDYQAGWKRGLPKGEMNKLEVWLGELEREQKKRGRGEGEEGGMRTEKGS